MAKPDLTFDIAVLFKSVMVLKLKHTKPKRLMLAALLCCGACLSNVGFANSDTRALFLQTPAAEHYDNALSLIDLRSYKDALVQLRRIQAYYPGFEKLSSVQTRIAVLQEADDAGSALEYYLDALNKRDSEDIDGALDALDYILQESADSSLNDDALYLKAYVQIMDRYDFEAARSTLAQLQQTHQESSYQDSADYLDAIALEQMGETVRAKAGLEALRDRHTAVALPFGFNWPAGNVLSRYWYDRADKRLAIIEKRYSNASRMRSKQMGSDSDALQIQVSVEGVDLELSLTPSPLTMKTGWVDGVMQDRSPPAAGVYVGKVLGDDASWVRAVIKEDAISGVAHAYGQQYTMQPGTLVGTLDYYQPRSSRTRSANNPDSISTEIEMQLDAIAAPLEVTRRAKTAPVSASDLRVVPISLVIDAEFDRYHGGNGLVTALNQLNVADGIYRQFGIALAVDEVQVFSNGDVNPMHSTSAPLETFLKSFRDYRLENRTLFSDSALTYLFTGKQRTDRTLGLAWIDTLCRTDGYDVGVTTPSAIGDVLLTHELGHSLGSQHDSDTGCNKDSTKIMWPHISSRTQIEFSECSLNMLSSARTKPCLIDAVDLSLSASGSAAGVQFDLSNLDSSVSLNATLSIETSSPGLVVWPAGCNKVSPTSANCAISELSAGEQRQVFLSVLDSSLLGDAIVTAQLTPAGTQDFTPSNNVASYSFGTQSASSGHLTMNAVGNGSSAVSGSNNNGTNTPPAAASGGAFSVGSLAVLLLLQIMLVLRRSKLDQFRGRR